MLLGALLGVYLIGGFSCMFVFANADYVAAGKDEDNIKPNLLVGLFWPVIMIVVFGSYVWELGGSLRRTMITGQSKQTEPSEEIDSREARLKELVAEREKITAEIIALRDELEKETPLCRGNLPGRREAKS